MSKENKTLDKQESGSDFTADAGGMLRFIDALRQNR